jgi:DNA-binding FadR family transcriptional regulator
LSVEVTTIGTNPETSVFKVSARLADRLRAEIATGRYRPGAFLPPESALMEQYGVGRPSMREALRILESDGLVRVLRGANGGAEVLPVNGRAIAHRAGLYLQLKGADLADVRVARDLIDPGAVRLAAEHHTPADVERLRSCIERVRECREGAAFGEIAADFVEDLLTASGNHTLALFALVIDRLLRQEFHRIIDENDRWSDGTRAAWFASEWTAVVDRIDAGDAEGAVEAWAAHRQRTVPAALRAGDNTPVVVYPTDV